MQIEHAIPKNVQLRKPVSSACFLCLTRKPINYPIASLFAGAACRAQKFIYFEIYFNWKSELQKERDIFRLLVHSSSGYYIPELDWSTAGSQELLGVPCGCQAPRTWDIFYCLPRPWAKKLDQKWSSQHKWCPVEMLAPHVEEWLAMPLCSPSLFILKSIAGPRWPNKWKRTYM